MEFKLLLILNLLAVGVVCASEAALSPDKYWNAKLPNTPMPQAIREILHSDLFEDKSTSVVVGGGGVGVNTGDGGGTQVGVGKGGVGVSTGKPGRRTNVGVGKGGVVVTAPGKRKPVYVGVKPGYSPFVYYYAASETQLQDDPNVALFFQEKDLVKGKAMTLHFTKSANLAAFLPRQAAASIPFSLRGLPGVMDYFSVKPGSVEARLMGATIEECEAPGVKGEDKYCATSLESMVDYVESKLGRSLKAVSTEIKKETLAQKYTIEEDSKKVGRQPNYVVCHKLDYPYAVFYCHKTASTRASVVSLKGEDGSEVKAVAVCHEDTSQWNPKHLAFQVLGVKPGSVPVCHFLPQDHIVWYGN
ncbi:hypothetical protein SAY87_026080 [Trapa incisa]|uniref:BURP domain-containing protein n=1 Tax=Trapa incisa TaxID=236973 RepID=A0AAN7GLK0_9MYRT|nr:hypothetical protein SAY87_026080 [Trapa incisa]